LDKPNFCDNTEKARVLTETFFSKMAAPERETHHQEIEMAFECGDGKDGTERKLSNRHKSTYPVQYLFLVWYRK
jgi:hypothetical protein